MRVWPFLKKKFIQLLLPCVTWYVLAYVLPKLVLMLLHKEGRLSENSDVAIKRFYL